MSNLDETIEQIKEKYIAELRALIEESAKLEGSQSTSQPKHWWDRLTGAKVMCDDCRNRKAAVGKMFRKYDKQIMENGVHLFMDAIETKRRQLEVGEAIERLVKGDVTR